MTRRFSEPPVVALAGPTAAGKTTLAIALWEALDGRSEIVSVDSVQIYRGMDIGTAKPDQAVRACIPHHMIDVLDPAQVYSAARFAVDARRTIANIRSRGHIPILVGGTMLYFRALLRGLTPLPSSDVAIRTCLETEAKSMGWPTLHARLKERDPGVANRIHPNDAQRIQRALEILYLTGKPASQAYACPLDEQDSGIGSWLGYALAPIDRSELHRRIEIRFDEMLQAGLLDEVRGLHSRQDLHPGLPSMRAVGYRQLWQYLENLCTLEEARNAAIAATRQYAKRQITWLRSESDFTPLAVTGSDEVSKILEALKSA